MITPSFKIVEEKKDKDYAKFVIEPLEPGFGNTLGVSLRRILLTSIEGAAITSVKIEGVRHMFTTLPGLKEDIVEFILNIKGLRVSLAESKNEAKIKLKKSGPAQLAGKDIEVTEGVEVINSDKYLGNLANSKSKIDMEMTVERGLGYSLAEEKKVSTIGVIPIDAIYSPVLNVSYKVEQTRVGGQTNYDKLVLEVWTDGTVDPKDALLSASKIAVVYFRHMYEPKVEVKEEDEATTPSISEDVLKITVDELDLPTRIYNSLKNAGIETVGDLLKTPRKELMAYRNLGAKSISVIEESLRAKGISLNI